MSQEVVLITTRVEEKVVTCLQDKVVEVVGPTHADVVVEGGGGVVNTIEENPTMRE